MKVWHNQIRGNNGSCIIRNFADGDTVNVSIKCDCPETWHIVTVRIVGIESCEKRALHWSGEFNQRPTPFQFGAKSKHHEETLAEEIKRLATSKFHGTRGELFLTQKNSDAYGRVLGDIRIGDKMLSENLCNLGYAWQVNSKGKPLHSTINDQIS